MTKHLCGLVIVGLLLTGCDSVKPSQPNQALREDIFFRCLQALPAGPVQSKYNDWDEVVAECGHQAYYLSLMR